MQKQMAREESASYLNGIPISWPSPIAPAAAAITTTKLLLLFCDSCNASSPPLFCRHHSAFLCLNCDANLHFNSSAHHHRVPVCQLCERAPAAVTCKADAASLCLHCDAHIHSANPLSRRHDRVPVVPLQFSKSAAAPTAVGGFEACDFLVPTAAADKKQQLLPPLCPNEVKSEDLFFTDFDFDILPDFEDKMVGFTCSDGVVPTHRTANASNSDFGKPNKLPTQTVKSLLSKPTTGSTGTDREARVLRYREKRKNRKFEKTIRYASRKAYAETRPRIKGRFAKRNDLFSDLLFDPESDAPFSYVADHLLPSDHLGYGVVPSYY